MGKIKNNNKNKVYLEFIGNNADGVTGSSIFVQFYDSYLERNYNILLELGLMQGKSPVECYKANMNVLNRIDAKSLDVVFLQHLHGDHSLLLPALYRKGFDGNIFTTKESKFCATSMFEDGYNINKQDIKLLISKGIKAKPYYEEKDIPRTVLNMDAVELEKEYTLTPNISFMFIPNRHILGSSSLILTFTDENDNKHKLFYSSDLGNVKFDKYFINQKQEPIDSCNIGIYESTYSAKERIVIDKKLRNKDVYNLHQELRYTLLEKKGNCLFPAFSLDRTPNLLYIVKQILDSDKDLKDIQVYVDGKLTNELLDNYSVICKDENKEKINELLQWENLIRIRAFKQTETVLQNKKPKIIFSSSGMCTNGHVIYYLERLLSKPENTIIFSGYSSSDSPATKIKNNAKLPKENKKIVKLNQDSTVVQNCDVLEMHSFSSHIMRDDLIHYITATNQQKCVLVHGDSREELAEDLKIEFAKMNKTTKVIVPHIGDKILF